MSEYPKAIIALQLANKPVLIVNSDNLHAMREGLLAMQKDFKALLKEQEAAEARHAAELREQAERFEAFRQEVSDAVEGFWNYCRTTNTPFPADLDTFILPKPDPLVEAIKACEYATLDAIEPEFAKSLRAALAVRGYEVRKIGEAGE